MSDVFQLRVPVVSEAPPPPPYFFKSPVVVEKKQEPASEAEAMPAKQKPLPEIEPAGQQGNKEHAVVQQPVEAKASSSSAPRLKKLAKSEVDFSVTSLPKQSVVVVGDSLSIPLGQRLEEYFAQYDDISFARRGKVSSGLARPDFYDWEKNLTEMVKDNKPTTLVIMIGTNDNKPLKRPNGKVVSFGKKGWAEEYARRMKRLFDIARKSNPKCRIFWVGAPIMEPRQLNTDVMRINHVIRALCRRTPNCRFVDTWDALADNDGQFTQYARGVTGERIRLRADDGVHVTHLASKILAVRCLKAIADAS